MSPIAVLICVGLGCFVYVIGWIMRIVAAFRESVWWGLGCLFVPFVDLVFMLMHWEVSKGALAVRLSGLVIIGGSLVASPEFREGLAQKPELAFLSPSKESVTRDLTAEIAEQRERIFLLESKVSQATPLLQKEYAELAAKRKALKPNDPAAIEQFNLVAVEYTKRKDEFKQMRVDLDAANEKLSALLADRSKAAPSGGAPRSSARVVMYTTKTCPACVAAKRYLAGKGVAYDNRDVEESKEAAAEFTKLGAQGVPLILVGDQRMEGFNAQQMNKMLGM